MHPSTIARIDHERSGNAKSNRERIASVIRSTTILLTAHEISEKCGINSVEVTRRLNEAEKETILATLTYTQGNKQYAADLLGVSLSILREKMSAHGMLE